MNDSGEQRGANPDLLKRDIDAGLTGDKVAFPDPAAAPLGTDDEAAGTPITPAQLDMARRSERLQGVPADDRAAHLEATAPRMGRTTVIVIAAAVVILLLVVAML